MVEYRNKDWLALLFTFRGSVLPGIASRIVIFTGFSAAFVFLNEQGVIRLHGIPSTPWTVVGVALGLLLVFRTNTAYDRYWEGRRLWGEMTNTTRHMAVGILSYVAQRPGAVELQQQLINLLISFPFLAKQRLRQEHDIAEVARFLSQKDQSILSCANHPPMAVLSRIASLLEQCTVQRLLTEERLMFLHSSLQDLARSIGGCERIRNTPLPIAYVLHMKRFLSLFCLTVSLPLVEVMGYWSILATALVSYAFIGIEEIGVEIEDPFGQDPNDLPLDKMCSTIEQNLTDAHRLWLLCREETAI